jgi:predicted HTH domain antitoxin
MHRVPLYLDRELLDLIPMRTSQLEDSVRELLVLELYRLREISSGKAAELLGMERFEFVRYVSRLGIPFLDMDNTEFQEEILNSKENI